MAVATCSEYRYGPRGGASRRWVSSSMPGSVTPVRKAPGSGSPCDLGELHSLRLLGWTVLIASSTALAEAAGGFHG